MNKDNWNKNNYRENEIFLGMGENIMNQVTDVTDVGVKKLVDISPVQNVCGVI